MLIKEFKAKNLLLPWEDTYNTESHSAYRRMCSVDVIETETFSMIVSEADLTKIRQKCYDHDGYGRETYPTVFHLFPLQTSKVKNLDNLPETEREKIREVFRPTSTEYYIVWH